MNSDNVALAERIRFCVNKVGNGNEFCRITGINRRTLDYYLSATSEPKAFALSQIAKAANVSLDWLITGNSETTGNAPLDEALLTEIVGYIDSEFKFEKAKNKAPLIVKIYAYILKKRAEREASKEKDTADIIDLIEVLKSAI